jgi:hypothetical protein
MAKLRKKMTEAMMDTKDKPKAEKGNLIQVVEK